MYIFLDFDGVTHPVSANGKYFRESCLKYLLLGMDGIDDLHIVITSTWRLDKSLQELTEYLGPIGKYVESVTPEINEPFFKYIRQLEVERYILEQNIAHHPWVAIDDTPAFYRPDAPLICTDGTTGFTQRDARKLKSLLLEIRRCEEIR